MTRTLVRALLALAATAPLGAQHPLTLGEALRLADGDGYRNRIADGEARAARARADGALRGILPTLRLNAGYVRTDDPLGAFGFTLQQGGVRAASFDPARLNNPTPVSNWNTGLAAEVPLFNADAWLGRGAAAKAADAAASSADWTRESSRLDVVRAYYGAILAAERERTLEAALRAAEAHVRQARSMVANGLATPSDALLADVERGRVEAHLLGARGATGIAKRQLALLLGDPDNTAFTLPDSLPGAERIRALLATAVADGSRPRADVVAARLGREAADRDARRAAATLLPRVNAFGTYDWNSPDAPMGGDGRYTVGVMASWSPFSGGAELAERSGARARADAARAMVEAAEATAVLEQATATSDVAVAGAQLEIAELAVTQGADAHRIVARKYAGGLATVAELLGAAAVETETRLGRVAARFHAIVATATLHRANGGALTALTALEN